MNMTFKTNQGKPNVFSAKFINVVKVPKKL